MRQLVDAIRESAAAGKTRTSSSQQPAGWKSVLQEEPTDPEVLALAQPGRLAEPFLYAGFQAMQIFAYDRFHLRVSGLEKLPAQGAYIISSNHQSYLDPLVLASVLPWQVFRNLFAVGTSEIFGSGFMRRLARWLRVIVVDPDANLVSAMRAGAFGLRHGRILILYPEGERSIDGTPRTFKKGAAILSIHLQVPIVPVAIEGFHDAWPRGKRFQKFAPLKIQIGDPIYPPPEAEASEAAYEKLTAELKARVVGMWKGLRGEPLAEPATQVRIGDCAAARPLYFAAAWAFCAKAFTKASTIIESYSSADSFAILSTAWADGVFACTRVVDLGVELLRQIQDLHFDRRSRLDWRRSRATAGPPPELESRGAAIHP